MSCSAEFLPDRLSFDVQFEGVATADQSPERSTIQLSDDRTDFWQVTNVGQLSRSLSSATF